MKWLVILLALVSGLFLVPKAECAWCPSYTCFSHCGGSCYCVTMGSSGGHCMSVERITPEMTVLP